MKNAWVIRHVGFEDLGTLHDVIAQEGYSIRFVEAGYDDLSCMPPLAPDLLVILGGPISVYEEELYPFIHDEVRILQARLAAERPILGICLGAQMIAKALGARVYPGPQKEIGWAPLALSAEGSGSPLAHLGPSRLPAVLHWHGDTFELPAGATRLASTPLYENQAFSYGPNTLALQFHPEVSARGMERWFIGHTGEIARTPGISVQGLRADTARYADALARQGGAFMRAWLRALR